MLYTFSHSQYDLTELHQLIDLIKPNDSIILWQSGVLLAVKYPTLFTNLTNIFILENDIKARGLTTQFNTISLAELVEITEKYSPQIAL